MVEDNSLLPQAQSAYALGMIDGQAKLARELLQEDAHRGPEAVDCDLTGAARR